MKLLNNERGPYTDTVRLNYVDLQAIGTGGTKQIGVIPAGGAVSLCAVIKTVAFVGSTSTVIDVGTTLADPDEFSNALNVSTATLNLPSFNTGDLMLQSAGTTTTLGGYLPIKPVAVDTAIYIKLTDAAVASITAGEIIIGFAVVDLLQFRDV